MKNLDENIKPSWLTPILRKKVRDVFDPRYGRILSNDEASSIAVNLADLMESIFKFEWRAKYGAEL